MRAFPQLSLYSTTANRAFKQSRPFGYRAAFIACRSAKELMQLRLLEKAVRDAALEQNPSSGLLAHTHRPVALALATVWRWPRGMIKSVSARKTVPPRRPTDTLADTDKTRTLKSSLIDTISGMPKTGDCRPHPF